MQIALILQIGLFVLLALGIVVIVAGALNAVPKGKKKAYRYSKKGDSWITKYDEKKKSKAY